MIDSKVRNMNHYLENPFPEMSFIELYCHQSFSGGGLYLKGSWLLWSMYYGLLWSVTVSLYMGHTSKWQIHTGDDHFLAVVGYNG